MPAPLRRTTPQSPARAINRFSQGRKGEWMELRGPSGMRLQGGRPLFLCPQGFLSLFHTPKPKTYAVFLTEESPGSSLRGWTPQAEPQRPLVASREHYCS